MGRPSGRTRHKKIKLEPIIAFKNFGFKYTVQKEPTLYDIDLDIFPSDIIAFGVTNMINAMIVFFVFSYIIKWWSTNCSRAPF